MADASMWQDAFYINAGAQVRHSYIQSAAAAFGGHLGRCGVTGCLFAVASSSRAVAVAGHRLGLAAVAGRPWRAGLLRGQGRVRHAAAGQEDGPGQRPGASRCVSIVTADVPAEHSRLMQHSGAAPTWGQISHYFTCLLASGPITFVLLRLCIISDHLQRTTAQTVVRAARASRRRSGSVSRR